MNPIIRSENTTYIPENLTISRDITLPHMQKENLRGENEVPMGMVFEKGAMAEGMETLTHLRRCHGGGLRRAAPPSILAGDDGPRTGPNGAGNLMITHLKIDGLRGILHAEVNDMTPLVIFVGPNGCGKSTFLDALMIGVSDKPVNAIKQILDRQPTRHRGEWLVHRKQNSGPAFIHAVWQSGGGEAPCQRKTLISPREVNQTWVVSLQTEEDLLRPDVPGQPPLAHTSYVTEYKDGTFDAGTDWTHFPALPVKLLDMSLPDKGRLAHQFDTAGKYGRRREVDRTMHEVFGDHFVSCQLGFQGPDTVVKLEFDDGTIPAALSGEGMYALVRMAIEMAATPGGTILIEEPEAHQHPRNLELLAKMMWAAINRGIQIVITTHSLEMIDLLVLNAPGERLGDLTLYHVRTHKDLHHLTRISGPDVKERLEGLGEDLR